MTLPAPIRAALRSLAQRSGVAVGDVVELYVERWAIRQHDGGFSEDEAAALAMTDVMGRYKEER